MFKLFTGIVFLGYVLSNITAATALESADKGTQTSSSVYNGYNIFRLRSLQNVCPMRVDLRGIAFEKLSDNILQAASSHDLVSLDLSGRQLHDTSLEGLVESLAEYIRQEQLKNIVEIDVSANDLTVEGVQLLMPFIVDSEFKQLNVSSNCLEGCDLFERLGTDAVYNEYVPSKDRVLLDQQSRDALMKKIIWLPRAFFDPRDASRNPSGMYVTSEVILQHRKYYNMAR